MTRLVGFLLLLLALAGCSRGGHPIQVSMGGGTEDVGNGGNPSLHSWFTRAKQKLPSALQASALSLKTLTSSFLSLGYDLPAAGTHAWTLYRMRPDLEQDIAKSPLAWTQQPQIRCGKTGVHAKGKTVQLSSSNCEKSVHGIVSAAEVLIHESLHHLGIGSEETADLYAGVLSTHLGARLLQEEDGALDPNVDGDLVCMTDKSLPQFRLVVEYFNGVARARIYEDDVFLGRLNCHDWPVKEGDYEYTIRCDAPDVNPYAVRLGSHGLDGVAIVTSTQKSFGREKCTAASGDAERCELLYCEDPSSL